MDVTKKRKLDENVVVFPSDLATAGGITTTTTTTLFSDDFRKIIEPFTHEQLSQIVITASLRHPDVLDAVRSMADRDPAQRKLFIRGLGWESTSEKLRTQFASYGDLDEAVVILDKVTGMSKGYGFLTFRHIDGALMALREPSKKIDGRMTVTQLASAGVPSVVTVTANSQTLNVPSRKIYVGNLPYDMPGDRLLAHFSSFGEVEEGPLGFDKTTGKSRGFALFVYKNVEGARASLVDPIKTIDGHQLNCKLANDGKRGNPNGVPKVQPAAMAAPASQVQAPGGGVKPEVSVDRPSLNLNQQSSMQGSFASQFGGGVKPEVSVDRPVLNLNQQSSLQGSFASPFGGGGPGGITGYGGNSGVLGLPGQGPPPPLPPLSHSQHSLNYNLGSGSGLSSFGSGGGGFSSGLGSGGYGVSGSHYGGPGPSHGGLSSAGGAGGTGFGSSGQRSHYGLLPSSARMSSGGYPESAHYSLSSGTAYQNQDHQKHRVFTDYQSSGRRDV